MESPRILMARFLLFGLYDIEPLEPIVRERERTLLAAGLPPPLHDYFGQIRPTILKRPVAVQGVGRPAPEAGSQDAQSTSAGCREREILPDPEPVLVSTPYKHGSLPERLYSHRDAHTYWRYRGRYNGWVRRIHLKGVLQVENVQFEVVEGNRLVIHVDLNHRGDISASGKTRRVASTLGNVSVKDANGVEIKIGPTISVSAARPSPLSKSSCSRRSRTSAWSWVAAA